jgi:putative MFS transporter
MIFTLAMQFGILFTGPLIDHLGRKILISLLLLVGGISILFIPFAYGNYPLMAILLIIGFGLTTEQFIPIYQIFASELYDTSVRATGVGAASAFTRAGMAASPIVGSMLLEMGIPMTTFFAVYAIPVLLAIPFLLLTKETKRKSLESISRTKEELEKKNYLEGE